MRGWIPSWQNILVASLSVGLALLLLELGSRFLPPPFDNPENAAQACWEQTGWRGQANFETTVDTEGYVHDLTLNQAGMHDSDHPFSPPNDETFRILLLGDSFVQAVQVPEAETTHQVLEDLLNEENRAAPIEVISGGVSGWGTGQQLLYYRHEGRLYQPDLVLLMFFLGNDVKGNLPGRGITVGGFNCYSPYFALAGDRLDPEPWLYAPGAPPVLGPASELRKTATNLLGLLHRHSHLYARLEPLLAPEPVQASMLDFYQGRNPTFDYVLALTEALVGQLEQEVRADGAEFGVVLISPLSLVEFVLMSPAEREEVYERFSWMRRAEQMPLPNETLAQSFSQNGAPVLDLLPAFLAHAQGSDDLLYFELDHHWTTAGNRLAAETMHDWLLEENLVPRP